jgi:carboxymethylenebutenolidase
MTMEIQQLMWKIEAIRDAVHTAVFADRDVDAALAALDEHCVFQTVAGSVGASGAEEIRRFLTEDVIPHVPGDLEFRRVSRTSDQRRVAHELIVSFTHDRELPWLLPGVRPTGRTVEVGAVSVGSFKHTSRLGHVTSRLTAYRITWDRLDLMSRLGVLDRVTAARA